MSVVKEKKLEKLYNYLNENGFELSVEAISQGIGISKKTFFNRYQHRKEMERIIQNYWRDKFKRRFEEKTEHCNNGVEIVLLFIFEILASNKNEHTFVQQELKTNAFLASNQSNNFISIIKNSIENYNTSLCFKNEINLDSYAYFLVYNIFYILLTNKQIQIDVIEFLLSPLLTEEGEIMLDDINLEMMFNS